MEQDARQSDALGDIGENTNERMADRPPRDDVTFIETTLPVDDAGSGESALIDDV